MGLVFQEPHQAQLVQLVAADHLGVHQLAHVLDVGFAGRHHRHAGARQGDLGGGSELKHQIGVPLLGAQLQNVGEGHVIPADLVDAVGVVPDHHEVGGGGLQAGDAADHLVGVNKAVGVGVLGDAPDALHLGVLGQPLHLVHVGAVLVALHGNQLDPEGLGHPEVPVVAGDGAQELHLLLLGPGLYAVEKAVGPGLGHQVIHHIQAGIAAHKALLGLHVQHLRPVLPGAGHSGQLAVVPGIHPVGHAVVKIQRGQQPPGQLQLLQAGLSPGHIQLQALALPLFELLFDCLIDIAAHNM